MGRNPKPNAGLPGLVQPQSPTIADSVGAERATPRNDPPIGNSSRASQPAMTNRTLGTNTQDETRAEDGASSGQSLRQALDRLATQLDDTTHTGIGLAVRLMIEHRDKEAKLRQSDGYPLVREMKRLRLPVKGPGAQDARLRFIHAVATPGTSSGWQSKLERDLFADIALVEELYRRGEGRYLEQASAGHFTIARLVSRLAHLRERLSFWAADLETYPPHLVHDIVGLIAEAARQLREAANLPACVSGGPTRASSVGSSTNASPPIVPALTKDHREILWTLAKSQGRCLVIADLTETSKYRNPEKVGRCLLVLEEHGLVDRPHGERKGRAITPAGIKLLEHLGPEEQSRR